MRSRFIRVAVLSAFALTSPLLIFAAGQPKVRMISQNELPRPDGATRAVQQGKGSGMSRNDVAIPASADRLQTAPNRADSAFRK
jgi:hypothetical protein